MQEAGARDDGATRRPRTRFTWGRKAHPGPRLPEGPLREGRGRGPYQAFRIVAVFRKDGVLIASGYNAHPTFCWPDRCLRHEPATSLKASPPRRVRGCWPPVLNLPGAFLSVQFFHIPFFTRPSASFTAAVAAFNTLSIWRSPRRTTDSRRPSGYSSIGDRLTPGPLCTQLCPRSDLGRGFFSFARLRPSSSTFTPIRSQRGRLNLKAGPASWASVENMVAKSPLPAAMVDRREPGKLCHHRNRLGSTANEKVGRSRSSRGMKKPPAGRVRPTGASVAIHKRDRVAGPAEAVALFERCQERWPRPCVGGENTWMRASS
jgi:hypothetical protein